MSGCGVSGQSIRNIRQGSYPVNRRGGGVCLEGGKQSTRLQEGKGACGIFSKGSESTTTDDIHRSGKTRPSCHRFDLRGEDLDPIFESKFANDAVEKAGALASRFDSRETGGRESDRQGKEREACATSHVEPRLRSGCEGDLQKLEGIICVALAKTRKISGAHEILLFGFLANHRLEQRELFELLG